METRYYKGKYKVELRIRGSKSSLVKALEKIPRYFPKGLEKHMFTTEEDYWIMPGQLFVTINRLLWRHSR